MLGNPGLFQPKGFHGSIPRSYADLQHPKQRARKAPLRSSHLILPPASWERRNHPEATPTTPWMSHKRFPHRSSRPWHTEPSGAAKARSWQSPFRQLPGSRSARGKHSRQNRAQGEGGEPVWARSQGWRGRGMWETGTECSEERGKGSLPPGGIGERQGMLQFHGDVVIPQARSGSGGFKQSMVSPFLTGRIFRLSRKDSQPLQERFPVSPGRISHLTWEGLPTSAGGIPHLSRKDSHSSKRNLPFFREGFPPLQEGFHNPPGGNPHPLQE